jgi:hypothetical protein
VNLAVELVDRRPTPANVELLTRSRVEPTRALVEATRGLPEPVPVVVQMSMLAIYGDAGEQVLECGRGWTPRLAHAPRTLRGPTEGDDEGAPNSPGWACMLGCALW